MQLKIYELFISGIFHVLFSDWISAAEGSETVKPGITRSTFISPRIFLVRNSFLDSKSLGDLPKGDTKTFPLHFSLNELIVTSMTMC